MEMFNSIQWLGKTIIIQKQNICPWILLVMLFIGDDGADFFLHPIFTFVTLEMFAIVQ